MNTTEFPSVLKSCKTTLEKLSFQRFLDHLAQQVQSSTPLDKREAQNRTIMYRSFVLKAWQDQIVNKHMSNTATQPASDLVRQLLATAGVAGPAKALASNAMARAISLIEGDGDHPAVQDILSFTDEIRPIADAVNKMRKDSLIRKEALIRKESFK